MTILYCCLF